MIFLATPCGCKNAANTAAAAAAVPETCPATVNQTVCVQADVTVTPDVDVGDVESFCVGDPTIGGCSGDLSPTGTCTFTVSQSICVQIPITFKASAVAVPSGIVCGTPAVGECGA